MKKVFLLVLFLVSFNKGFSQSTNEKIYFLADTINTSKENQLLRIESINFFENLFTFYCRCAPPYKNYVSFSCITKKGEKKPEIVSHKPDFHFISFKELMDIANKYNRYFDDTYDLYIVEVLPGKKYRTSKVKYVAYSPPTVDSVIIKDE